MEKTTLITLDREKTIGTLILRDNYKGYQSDTGSGITYTEKELLALLNLNTPGV